MEVVIMAAAATTIQGSIVCIEEPELHLNPLLQRKFIRYLVENTDNQYLITTHSAHFLDHSDTAIFRVSHDGNVSTVERAIDSSSIFSICRDLGYKASDFLQTNCVIWVEGPSDRIYLSKWLNQISPEFLEGIHYSIMFYGGRLLSHLSGDEGATESEFISLIKLNRHMIVLIDSDKSSDEDEINSTKKRIQKEFNENGGLCWITAGREIENYIDPAVMKTGIAAIHPAASIFNGSERYTDNLSYSRLDSPDEKRGADKVKLARHLCAETLNIDLYDLREQLDKVVGYVREANK
jgi:hypothetical protein